MKLPKRLIQMLLLRLLIVNGEEQEGLVLGGAAVRQFMLV